ncbi:MAG TPA: acyltransferase [Steroidobacteraceae bacterium]|nr:acyltransferase [Steroidobacteraceae bacterium]
MTHRMQMGNGAFLLGKPSVGARNAQLRIGDRFRLASRPVESHLSVGPAAVLSIGDDVWIGHGAAIASHERVEIGDRTRIGPFLILMDSNFHSGAGDQSEQHDCKPVIIGKDCRIGSRVTITRGSRIGDGARVLAGSVINGDIPPGACAGGARARVLGRATEVTSQGYVAALALPGIVREALELDSVPALDDASIAAGLWTEEHVQRLTAAIRSELGITLTAGDLRDVGSLADVAAIVQRKHS